MNSDWYNINFHLNKFEKHEGGAVNEIYGDAFEGYNNILHEKSRMIIEFNQSKKVIL